MRHLKLLFKIFLALLILAMAALAVFAALFDPNDYRERVAGLVREQTGRELVLAGPLKLSLFPWLAVEAEDVALGNAPGFDSSPMLKVRRVSAELQLLPLLSRELRVGRVTLSGLELFLERNAEGRTNWDDLLETTGGTEESQATQPAVFGQGGVVAQPQALPEQENAGFRLTDFRLEGLEAEEVGLVWKDGVAKTQYELSDGELRVGAVRFGAPLDLEAEFGFRLASPELTGRFRLAGNLAFDLEKQQYAMPRLTLALRAEGGDVPGGEAEASLAANQVRVDLDKGTASVSAFTLQAYGAQVSGSCSVRDLLSAPAASGVLELKRCDLHEVLAALGQELPSMRDATALTALGVTLRFDSLPDGLNLPYLSLDLDGQHLEGSARVRLDRPEYALALHGEQLDLDRYLPPKGNASEQGSGRENKTVSETAQASENALDGGDANATRADAEPDWLVTARQAVLAADLGVERIRAGGMELSGLWLSLHAKHGVLAVEPLDVHLQRGEDEYRLVTGRVFGDLRQLSVRADSFGLTAPGGGVSGSLSASNLLSAPEASGALTLDHLDLRRLGQALADLLPVELPQTSDPKALTDLHGKLEFRYAPGIVEVPDFDLLLDGRGLKGHALLRAEPAEYDVALKAERLDLDRYLPPEAEQAKPEASVAEAVVNAEAEGNGTAQATEEAESTDWVAKIREMRADADLDVAALRVHGLDFTDIKAVLHAREGKLDLDPFQLSLDKGRMELAWNFDAAGEGQSHLTTTVRGLALGKLLLRFAKINDVRGTLTLRTIEPLTWTGLDAERFKRSFSGSTGFAVRDGQYPGLNLFEMLTVVDKLTSAVLEGGKDESTKFGEVTGTMVARQGRVNIDDLCVKAPGLRAGGEGFVNLPDGHIDYLVRAMAVTDASGQGGAPCGDYYGIPVPVRISGTIENPRYRVSAEEYAASVARGAVGLLGGVVQGGAEAVGTVLNTGSEAVQGAAKGIVEGGSEAVQGGTEAVGGAVEGAVKGGTKAVEDFIDELKGVF
ncbi:MAG: AsmA family protein [Desulfovibrio sp.]